MSRCRLTRLRDLTVGGGAIALLLLAGCSDHAEPVLDLTLRSRVDVVTETACWSSQERGLFRDPAMANLCELRFDNQVFRTADGEQALISGHTRTAFYPSRPMTGETSCGEEDYALNTAQSFSVGPAPHLGSADLILPDGTEIALEFSREVLVFDPVTYFYLNECTELDGSWYGRSGELVGRSGRFEWLFDSVQHTLSLTEEDAPFVVSGVGAGSESTTPTRVEDLEPHAPALDAFAQVQAAYEDHEDEDRAAAARATTWVDLFGISALGSREEVEAMMAAGQTVEERDCLSHGFGEWPKAYGVDATGFRFTCQATYTNQFYAPAGMELSRTDSWITTEEGVIAARSTERLSRHWSTRLDAYINRGDPPYDTSFNSDFREWLRGTHPDVHATMRFTRFDFPAPESVPVALEYVDEYVDTSPYWPISP